MAIDIPNMEDAEFTQEFEKLKIRKLKKRITLDKYMPQVVGWDKLKPLPKRFTAWPDLNEPEGNTVFDGRKDKRIIVDTEMTRLIPDGRPTFIDLFSGCGGFSLGFIMAGWRCIASVELEYWASVTYCANIPTYQQAPLHVYICDIRELTGREILLNARIPEVDAIIGGPPCQSFSLMGKREIGDCRDNMIFEFGRLIKEIQPRTFIMENVPGIRSKKLANGRKILDVYMDYMESKDASDLKGVITEAVMNGYFSTQQ